MKNAVLTFAAMAFLAVSGVSAAFGLAAAQQGAGAFEALTRGDFKSILSSADIYKDGKRGIRECHAIWEDKKTAEKKCKHRDVDGDGTITGEEYVRQSKQPMK